MLHPQGRIGHVALRVRSLAVSVPFYTDVLGLRAVARLDDEGIAVVSFGQIAGSDADDGFFTVDGICRCRRDGLCKPVVSGVAVVTKVTCSYLLVESRVCYRAGVDQPSAASAHSESSACCNFYVTTTRCIGEVVIARR